MADDTDTLTADADTDTKTDDGGDAKKSWLAKLGVTQFTGGSSSGDDSGSSDDSSASTTASSSDDSGATTTASSGSTDDGGGSTGSSDDGGGQTASDPPASTSSSIWDAASNVVQTVSDAASTAVQDVEDAGSAVVQTVEDAGNAVVQDVSNLASSVTDATPGGADDSSSSPAVANLVSAVTDGGGFNLEIEVPLGKREIDISDKVKGEAEGTANGKAKVDGGGAATVTLDKNGWGVKVTEAIWSSKAKVQLGGVDLFANPKFEEESAANANERSFKVSFSVETPLGKLAVAAIPFKISGTESKLGAIEGSLEGKPAQFGEAEVEGVKFSDIELCFTFKFTVSPDWAKIIAEQLKKRALNAAEDAAGDAAIDLAIDGGLIFVAIGVIAGTANELSKASDQRQLIGTVAYCYNRFTDGLHKGLTGEPTPGDPWGDAGWKPGNKMYSDAVNKALQADPNAVIDEIQANVANKARKIASSMDGQIKTKIGDQFWKRWVAANHGVGTFLGDAKSACATCYGEAMVADNDPRLNDWKEASSLPGFLK